MTILSIALPDWVDDTVRNWSGPTNTDESRMDLAIELSRLNVLRGGGPFAALAFGGDQLLGAGVNRVVSSGFSIAHAEILALMSAQQTRRERLCDVGRPLTLVTTTDPCCQCYGAAIWANIERLICGATTADAEAIGFDEGPKPTDWVEILERRGVQVRRQLGRELAIQVHRLYLQEGGKIYGTANCTSK
ncbi:MAG TPA: nucleoside deaminase [Polyangiaceae bacterium]